MLAASKNIDTSVFWNVGNTCGSVDDKFIVEI